MIYSFVWLLLFIAGIVCLYKILTSSMDATKKLVWSLVVIFLPVFGPILFFAIRPDVGN